jgi:glycine betaine/proline transport system substrate-binding protein
MKKLIIAGIAAAMATASAEAADLGAVDEPIRLAINEWTGQHVATHVAGQILEKAGYKVEYVTAGYMNMWQAMADGEVHGAMEVWTSNVSEQFGALEKAGKIVDISGLGLAAKEGFAYPAHVEDICPGLPDWKALMDCAPKFATAETLPMGRLVDYPADWGTPGADRTAGLQLPYKAVPAGSEGALIAELRASTEKKSPLLIVFWQPHWAMSAYNVKFVELPKGEPACYDDPSWGPNPNATSDCDFIPTRIFKAGWAGMQAKWPAAYEILENYKLSTEQQQPMMGAVDVDGKKIEDVVAAWMTANEGAWKSIVDAATN